MSKQNSGKQNSRKRRLDLVNRALLKQHKLAVVSMSNGNQYLINYKTGVRQSASSLVLDALTRTTHQWCIYIGAFGIDHKGDRYVKTDEEMAVHEYYLSSSLAWLVHQRWEELLDKCNESQILGSGWIAIPDSSVTLDTKHAFNIFQSSGAFDGK